jgi:hypothetical protein
VRIWFTEIGEPLPIEDNVRLLRYGMLTKALSSQGHEVVWWASSFSHGPKKHLVHSDTDLVSDGVRLKLIKGPGYHKSVSLQRVRHQKHFAKAFYQKARENPLPDIIISPIPTIETAEMAVRFSRECNIPILIDIRDEWPDEFVNLAPSSLRWLMKLLLHGLFQRMSFICRNAMGIIAMSDRQLQYGLSFAMRKPCAYDGVFPHGYTTQRIDEWKLAEASQWWKDRGVDGSAFICCFFGTIGRFFYLEIVIKKSKNI